MKIFTRLLLIICIFIILSNTDSAAAEIDPYTIYGTVKDENGAAIAEAVITVTNENTNEKNTAGNDTITGNPVPVTTDSDGKYTFELTNLKSTYNYGDKITVTAEIDGKINGDSVILKEGNWGSKVDIILGIKRKEDNGSLFGYLSIILVLLLIGFFIALVVMVTKHKKQKPKDIQPLPPTVKKNLPPPPPGWRLNKEKISIKEQKGEEIKELKEETVFECPVCGCEIGIDTAICPRCKSELYSDDEQDRGE